MYAVCILKAVVVTKPQYITRVPQNTYHVHTEYTVKGLLHVLSSLNNCAEADPRLAVSCCIMHV